MNLKDKVLRAKMKRFETFDEQLADKANQSELNVEKERINQIIANPGSTSGDLALNDIKIDVNGKVWGSPADAVRGQVNDLKNYLAVAKNIPSYTKTDGAYINTSGVITSQLNYFYSDLITVNKGDVVKVLSATMPTWGSTLSKWTSDGTFIKNINSGNIIGEYTVTDDIEYLRFSAYKLSEYYIYVYSVNSNSYKILEPTVKKTIEEEIVVSDFTQNVIGYNVKTYIGTKAGTQNFESNLAVGNIYGVKNNANGVISFDLLDGSGALVKSYGSIGIGSSITVKVDVEHSTISCWSSVIANLTITLLYSEKTTNGRIYNIENEIQSVVNFGYLLGNICCIGDSLTEGAYYKYNDSGQIEFVGINKNNYPYFISKMTGMNVQNEGLSGSSPSSRWTYFSSYDFTPYESFLMWWGTNNGLTDTLLADGVIDTQGNLIPDYTTYANTNTGCYCKVIGRIISQVPNAKIFIANLYSQANLTTSNNVINKIIALYPNNVAGLVDMFSEGKFWSGGSGQMIPYCHPSGNIHFTTVGNYYLASHWIEKINKIISDNPQKMERFVQSL